MLSTRTTVVVLVGASLHLPDAANVSVVDVDADLPPLDRAVAAHRHASRATTPYLLHDADPLAAVAAAWRRRFDEEAPPGELEVAVTETVARWRAKSIELPDYYLVADPESLAPTMRHWYLGVVRAMAPGRVLPVDHAGVESSLASLPAGKWWPDLDDVLDGVDRAVPDLVGTTPADESRGRLHGSG
jgi:hypothetical protein